MLYCYAYATADFRIGGLLQHLHEHAIPDAKHCLQPLAGMTGCRAPGAHPFAES